MAYKFKYRAAFINLIRESGTKEEALESLHEIWDELMNLRGSLVRLGFTPKAIKEAEESGTFGEVF